MEERPKRERKVFLLRGHFLDEAGRQKSRILQKVSCEAYGGDLQRFLDTTLGQIDRLASEKRHPEGALVCGVGPPRQRRGSGDC